MVREKEKPVQQHDSDILDLKDLILYNDEVNSFDFVIESLIDVCRHDREQAEQCTLIAHFKGKCGIKSGNIHDLKPFEKELTKRGLTVSIE